MRRRVAALCLVLVTGAATAAAQTTSRPGPWTADVRGVTSPVPEETVFYPTLDRSALVPSRGFGLDVGAHVYLFDLGASRVGIGLNAVMVRALTRPPDPPPPAAGAGSGTGAAVQDLQLDLRLLAPQVSFNFGTRNGWSYLSAGAGPAEVVTRTAGVLAGRRESERVNALNVGGGARWFIRSHLAFGFDIRLHRIAAGTAGPIELSQPPTVGGGGTDPMPTEAPPRPPTPGTMILVIGAGLSIR